jgi:glycosyltransferase involved in cell wall biosynthesis
MTPGRAYRFSPALWSALRARRRAYDVFHGHSYHSLATLAPVTVGARPFVFTPHYHGSGHTRVSSLLHRPYRVVGRAIVESATRVVCVSEPERGLLEADFPFVANRTVVIPNGVDVAQIAAATPMDAAGRILLVAGRLEPYKRIDRVIESLAHLPPEWSLVVIGEGSDASRLRQVAAVHGVASRTRFTGFLEEGALFRWLRRADVVVTLSEREALGITVLEAAAAGAAVVASDIPAHRYAAALADGSAVSLVPPDGGGPLVAEAVSGAVRSSRVVAIVPTWHEVVDQLEAVYLEVAAG